MLISLGGKAERISLQDWLREPDPWTPRREQNLPADHLPPKRFRRCFHWESVHNVKLPHRADHFDQGTYITPWIMPGIHRHTTIGGGLAVGDSKLGITPPAGDGLMAAILKTSGHGDGVAQPLCEDGASAQYRQGRTTIISCAEPPRATGR